MAWVNEAVRKSGRVRGRTVEVEEKKENLLRYCVKIFSYRLNVDTNVHIYIFCNKHIRCLQLHFIYDAHPALLFTKPTSAVTTNLSIIIFYYYYYYY